jgi:hypothetical protein
MPFNRQCTNIFSQFRSRSSNVIFTQNLKNAGYLINILVSLILTKMVVPVIPDIHQVPTGFGGEFNGFHQWS